jgi:hypothetical protein
VGAPNPLDLRLAPPVARVLDLDPSAVARPVFAAPPLRDDTLQPVVADGLEQRLPVVERIGKEAERRGQFELDRYDEAAAAGL